MPGRAPVTTLRRLLAVTVGAVASLALVPAGAAHADASLVVTTQNLGQAFPAEVTDPLDPEVTITAESDSVAPEAIEAEVVTLPDGLALVRTGPAAWSVRGTPTVVGVEPAQLRFSDGVAEPQDVVFAATVVKDAATVTSTTPATVTVAPGEPVTLSATVSDPDGTGTPTGTVAFADGDEPLCSGPVTGGTASCTVEAAFAPGAASRTYQVTATLVSDQYVGGDGPDPLVVSLTPTLTASGPSGVVPATASEPIADDVTVTAESNVRDEADLTATASGLPAGLTLTRPDADEAAWVVTGRVTAAAGDYAVTVTVSDGAGGAADTTVGFTMRVAKDGATLVYDGDRAVEADGVGTDVATVELEVVAADLDAHPLPVTGTVVFTDGEGGETLCSSPIADGRGSCDFDADLTTATRTYDVVATLTSPQYTGSRTSQVVVSTEPTLQTAALGDDPVQATATDPLTAGLRIEAASNVVGGDALTATASGLPDGLSLIKTVDEDTATFTLTGTPDVDAGSYQVTVTVSDGAGNAADEVVTLTVVVAADDAVVTYTGPTAAPVQRSGQPVALSATVVDGDGSAPVTGTVAFTDAGTTLCTAPVVDGAATCSFAATFTGRSRTYAVVATLDSPRFEGATAQPAGLVVRDLAAPNRPSITAGPRAGSIVLADKLTFRYTAEPGARVQCRLTGAWTDCPATGVTYDRPAAGTHDFRVRAVDAAGNVSPVLTRRVVVPVDDRAMTSSGPWQKRTTPSAYRGTYAAVVKRGASLTYRLDHARSVSLVVTRSPGYGGVDVFLGSRRLKTITSTAAPTTRFRQLVKVADFATPTTGTLRVVTRSASQVVVEGLAVTRSTTG